MSTASQMYKVTLTFGEKVGYAIQGLPIFDRDVPQMVTEEQLRVMLYDHNAEDGKRACSYYEVCITDGLEKMYEKRCKFKYEKVGKVDKPVAPNDMLGGELVPDEEPFRGDVFDQTMFPRQVEIDPFQEIRDADPGSLASLDELAVSELPDVEDDKPKRGRPKK